MLAALSSSADYNLWLWGGFGLLVVTMLILDLGVFNKQAHVVTMKESLIWTVVWIALAMAFNVFIHLTRGSADSLSFFTGYVIEKSLSVDNVFVFAVLFTSMAVPPIWQHKVLFWGILAAVFLRGVMIFIGAALIAKYAWIIYIFGAFLILTGIKMLFASDKETDPKNSPILKLLRKFVPITEDYDPEGRLFVMKDGKRYGTPLLAVLILVGFTDVIFAVDSIPAIFAVTTDTFIVLTSNVFAIMGLRALFFTLKGFMDKFTALKYGLGVVLAFVGTKMLLAHTPYKIDTLVSLGIITGILGLSVVWSLARGPVKAAPSAEIPS
jgi:tellurite resistance protein TerC